MKKTKITTQIRAIGAMIQTTCIFSMSACL
jgi:hypothetical protein